MHRDPHAAAALPDAWRGWIDSLVEREVLRLRARYELSLDELRGLYIGDAQVDALLRQAAAGGAAFDTLADRVRELAPQLACSGAPAALAWRLGLSDDEIALLLLALAPDVDVRYETLFAYLNNDIARRHLSIDLAQRLLDDRVPDVRELLAPQSPLLASGAIELIEPTEPRSRRMQGLRVSTLVGQFCQGLPLADPRWSPEVRWVAAMSPAAAPVRAEPLLLIRGDETEERWAAALQWAHARALPLLRADASLLAGDERGDLARSLLLAARLAMAALVIDEDPARGLTPTQLARLAGQGVPLLLLAAPASPLAGLLGDWPHRRIDVAPPDAAERAALWQLALHEQGLHADARLLADRHALTATRIRAAVAAACWGRPADAPALQQALDAEAAARANHGLARLATRLEREHRWEQLVLADNTAAQLREVAGAIRVRETVYRHWGLQRRTGRSAGLMLLFCGASGTGKTMAASVVANAAGMALYRIDLAAVVSKYIGETEQNLERIFRAAERSSAVLLFDEADALLGRRSEVKDAHDRYANLETAYLLQKMEEHDGVVILSSNLPKNMDSAFARRMHYTVEFARPGPALRERLWRGMLPETVPCAPDIEFVQLAERFEFTGGEIQAATLDAAFLAAAEGSVLAMRHLLHAVARRQAQQGNSVAVGRACGLREVTRPPR